MTLEKMKTILLVEDNPDDVFLMRRIFRKENITATLEVVTDGKQAVEYLEAKDKRRGDDASAFPDLIFLDLKLPFLDGFDVLAWIRRSFTIAPVPVVILTSSLEDQDREKASAFGVPFLVKPPTAKMVHDAIRFAATVHGA